MVQREAPAVSGAVPSGAHATVNRTEQAPRGVGPGCNTGDGSGGIEADEHRLTQRQKQVDYGKNTGGYDNYIKKIPM
jgi:hypothetical protein